MDLSHFLGCSLKGDSLNTFWGDLSSPRVSWEEGMEVGRGGREAGKR